MTREEKNLRERVVEHTKSTGILPCIKLHEKDDFLAYAKAMYDGGARVIEVTMTTPGVLEAIEAISNEYRGRLWVAAGTVLDVTSAREVILHGGSVIVNPCLIPEVIALANRYGIPTYSGAFTATECLAAMQAGAAMVKIFPAALGGPKYMTNLKMVYPEINLIPSGGVSLDNAADFIQCGACAVSGARTFMNMDMIRKEGIGWVTKQVAKFIQIVREAKKDLPQMP
jgi:2-dehydro-3-deoxyphosphogluconate aldolase/(4S)-4-hydroxy-2-oxoglutarate aldolase